MVLLGLADGAVGISKNAYYEKLVPADVRAEVDDHRSQDHRGRNHRRHRHEVVDLATGAVRGGPVVQLRGQGAGMALIEAIDIGKAYPGGVVANDGVNLAVEPGEVHAVVGENGAGKSTLMKILFGIEQPDPAKSCSTASRSALPVRATPSMPASAWCSSISRWCPPSRFTRTSPSAPSRAPASVSTARRPSTRCARSPRNSACRSIRCRRCGTLPVGQQQRVEILKALYRNARILILDEPTAVLAPQEVAELFVAVRSLVAQGRTVIFIAHKLPEVLEISDPITVMRQGKTVGTVKAREVTEKSLATMMVGREITLRVDRADTGEGAVAAEIEGLRVVNARGNEVVAGLDLKVRAGEIVGLVGVEGNGQAELLEAVAGLRPIAAGRIRSPAKTSARSTSLRAPHLGLASIPEDRIAEGLATGASVAENLVATRLDATRATCAAACSTSRPSRANARTADRAFLDPRLPAPTPPSARCRAATCRRSWSPANSPSSRSCCWSTSQPAASISAPPSSSGAPSPMRATHGRFAHLGDLGDLGEARRPLGCPGAAPGLSGWFGLRHRFISALEVTSTA